MGLNLASKDMIWAIGEQADHVGFVQSRTCSLQTAETNSGYLRTRREGLQYLNGFWEESGDQKQASQS